jgi:hypothetical protein
MVYRGNKALYNKDGTRDESEDLLCTLIKLKKSIAQKREARGEVGHQVLS